MRGEKMKETILTDRGRQTCKEQGEKTEETQEGKETGCKTKQDTTRTDIESKTMRLMQLNLIQLSII